MQRTISTLLQSFPWVAWRGLIRPAIFAGVIGICAVIGPFVSPTIVAGLGALFAGVAGYLFLSRRMEVGILAVLPATFLVPWTVGTGTAIPLNTTILLLSALFAIWLLKMLVLEKNFRLAPSPVNGPVLVFIGCTTLSLLIGNLPLVNGGHQSSFPAQAGGWLLYVYSAAGILLVSNHFRAVHWLKRFLWIFLGLGLIYLLACWRFGIWGANTRFFQEGISGAVFWTMLAAIGAGQALCNRDLDRRWRLLAGGIAALSLAFGWVRGKEWLAGWLPPVGAVWIILWLRNWKLGLTATIAGGLLILPMYPQLYAEINSDSQQWSTYSRFLTWPIMFELVKVNPVFGLGMTNYHQYTPLYSLYGYYLTFNSHNNYWDLAAQTGLLGLGAFLWMAWKITQLGFLVLRRAADGFTRSYAITSLAVFAASLASGMMADWFLPFLYNIGFAGFRSSVLMWLLLGGLVSLYLIQQRDLPGGSVPA